MDTVILAAGANERLRGIVPPYHKPLLVVNGRPIIVDLVTNAAAVIQKKTDRIVIVCAPQNVCAIRDVLSDSVLKSSGRDHVRFVVQAFPTGPVQALALGLEVGRAPQTLMLCGDNIIDKTTWAQFNSVGPPRLRISVQSMPMREASRFTVVNPTTAELREEGESRSVFFSEGPTVDPGSLGNIGVWIGPVSFATNEMERALSHLSDLLERSFSNLFNQIVSQSNTDPVLVPSRAVDVGTPEALS